MPREKADTGSAEHKGHQMPGSGGDQHSMDPSNMSGHEGMEMNTPGEMTGMNMDSTSTGHNHGIK